MKWVLILSSIYLLQACDSFDTGPTHRQTFDKVPNSWHISGRLGVIFNSDNQNAGFTVDFTQQDYQLILTGVMGFGQIVIESNAQGLTIDGAPVALNFKQWMTQQMGWYFPVHDLGKIVFNQPFNNPNWQLIVLSRHPNHLPKTIRLIHAAKDIHIKLIFKIEDFFV